MDKHDVMRPILFGLVLTIAGLLAIMFYLLLFKM